MKGPDCQNYQRPRSINVYMKAQWAHQQSTTQNETPMGILIKHEETRGDQVEKQEHSSSNPRHKQYKTQSRPLSPTTQL